MSPLAHGRSRLVADLVGAGVPSGRSLLVHASLRRVGPVDGGAATVLAALQEVIGPDATVVVPSQTANNSTTSEAFRQATSGMTEHEIEAYEAGMPGFDRAHTPSYRMGLLAEHLRTRPEAVRSAHPQTSFAAIGPTAAALMAVHSLDSHLGERSPLAALYREDAQVLLLGVGFDRCTVLHLAEHRLPWPPRMRAYRCFGTGSNGERVQHDFLGVDLDDSDFALIGAELGELPFVRYGEVGQAEAITMPVRAAVDFAVAWMAVHRGDRRV